MVGHRDIGQCSASARLPGIITWDLAIVLVLLASASAKLYSGHSPLLGISRSAYFGLAVLEPVLAVGILCGGAIRRLSLAVVLILCLAGAVWVHWIAERPCGCFGSTWLLSKAAHSSIAAALGIGCLLALAATRPAIRR